MEDMYWGVFVPSHLTATPNFSCELCATVPLRSSGIAKRPCCSDQDLDPFSRQLYPIALGEFHGDRLLVNLFAELFDIHEGQGPRGVSADALDRSAFGAE